MIAPQMKVPGWLHRWRSRAKSSGVDLPRPSFSVGNRFELDNVFGPVVALDEYEVKAVPLHSDDVVVDVGAHIGAFTYMCYRQGSRAIHGYEPGERNWELLRRNVGALPGVQVTQAAVWRSDGAQEIELKLSGAVGENTGAHTLLGAGRAIDFEHQTYAATTEPALPVRTIALDAILQQFDRVKLLKVDCEGSEFPILLTSRELYRVERLVGEVHEVYEGGMPLLDAEARVPGYPAYNVESLAAFLEAQGFQVRIKRGEHRLHWIFAARTPPL